MGARFNDKKGITKDSLEGAIIPQERRVLDIEISLKGTNQAD